MKGEQNLTKETCIMELVACELGEITRLGIMNNWEKLDMMRNIKFCKKPTRFKYKQVYQI